MTTNRVIPSRDERPSTGPVVATTLVVPIGSDTKARIVEKVQVELIILRTPVPNILERQCGASDLFAQMRPVDPPGLVIVMVQVLKVRLGRCEVVDSRPRGNPSKHYPEKENQDKEAFHGFLLLLDMVS
jgi:hypothetical protein